MDWHRFQWEPYELRGLNIKKKNNKKNKIISIGLRISRFRQFSIGEMYSSALNTYDSVLQSGRDSFNQNIGDSLNNFLGGGGGTTVTTITFSSTVIVGGAIPQKYTTLFGNELPGVQWSAVSNAQSYAYVINQTNSSGNFQHLLLKNIPSTVTKLDDGSLGGGEALTNSFGVQGYTGPDSSLNSQLNFYMYALSVASISATDTLTFYSELEKNKIGFGSFSGSYTNSTALLFV